MKGISTMVAIILMVVIAITLVSTAYMFIAGFFTGKAQGIEIVDTSCSEGEVNITIRNIGTASISSLKIKQTFPPYDQLTAPFQGVMEPGGMITYSDVCFGEELRYCIYRITPPAGIPVQAIATCGEKSPFFSLVDPAKRNLTFVANTSTTTHWVVFDYITGEYIFFSSDDTDLTAEHGPSGGNALVLEGVNEYTIQTSWSSWDNRPLDTPIVIVRNPTPTSDWIFNWTDPHGSFLFHLSQIENALDDFLVFWEDLFDPFNPPGSIDDWKDHVVRVTIIPPSTYRLAVYLAKGGYQHEFYVATTSPNPVEGEFAYEKPFGAWWSNKVGEFYEEDKVYYIMVE